jgi:uncharacterized protein (DUF697 family)
VKRSGNAVEIPVDVRALWNHSQKMLEARDLPVRIAILVEIDAPDELLDAVREELRPKTAKAFVDVAVIEPGSVMRVDSSADAAVVLVGGGGVDMAETLRELNRKSLPTVALALRADRGEMARLLGHPETDVLTGEDAREIVLGPLAEWMMARLSAKRVAVAHNFAFTRRAVSREAVKSTAWQNAAIGAITILPGTDMPIMTANQGKMLLQIAAAYGEPLGYDRVKELAAVVGGGFLFRALARQLLDFVPGFGWAIKGVVGYSGTMAMGEAAIRYFEQGADLTGVLGRLGDEAGKVSERAREIAADRAAGAEARHTRRAALATERAERKRVAAAGGYVALQDSPEPRED